MKLNTSSEESVQKIGYARVSTSNQKLDMQLDALSAAGCNQVFYDHGESGAKANRPGLDEALSALRPGSALVVFKLCRLGRSVLHLSDLLTRFKSDQIHFVSLSEGINTDTPGGKLVFHIFASMAEFQRDLIRENTVHGLQAARDRGQKLGRPFALDEYAVFDAYQRIAQEDVTISDMARSLDVSYSTMKRAFERFGLI